MRRTAQLARKYPHLKVHDIRGNLNTRLAKLDADDSKYAGIVLAQAGLVRMNWHKRINYTIEPEEMLYAVGQGALAVECRSTDTKILEMLRPLICHETQCRILAERSFLKTLGGGCSAPVAVHSTLSKANSDTDTFDLNVIGSVWSLDGSTEINATRACQLKFNYQPIQSNASIVIDDIEIPTKKQKLSIEIDSDIVSSDEPSPPQIVDHSLASTTQSVDLIGLINIHSEEFKKCPHAKSMCPTQSHVGQDVMGQCPMQFAVGSDVMGQCPYIDQSKPINTTSSNAMECPFKKSHGPSAVSAETESSGNTESKTKQCPFLKRSAEVSITTTEDNTINKKHCPFLEQSTTTEGANMKHSTVKDETNGERLFCGLYPHQCWPIDAFEQCEQLGKDLANKLIDNGALAVMECAQAEIRQKI